VKFLARWCGSAQVFVGVRNLGLGDECTLAGVCEWVRIDPRALGDKLYLGVSDRIPGERSDEGEMKDEHTCLVFRGVICINVMVMKWRHNLSS